MIPTLIIVTGLPCSGKTTLARAIAGEFKLPLIHKDGIKELLFDNLGWSDRTWSKKLGVTTYALMYYFLEVLLRAGRSGLVESNFSSVIATPVFNGIKEKYPFKPIQILCKAEGDVLRQRFRTRAESGERHAGHVDQTTYEEMDGILLEGRIEPLIVGGHLFEVDTTDFLTIDYAKVFNIIQKWMGDEQ